MELGGGSNSSLSQLPPPRSQLIHNSLMRNATLLLFLVAGTAYAQLEPNPSFNADRERVPKTERYYNYVNDEQRSRKEFEAAAKAMLSPKFRSALTKFEPGDASDLIPTWGEFITATGT